MEQVSNFQRSKLRVRVFEAIMVMFSFTVLLGCGVRVSGSSLITGNVRPAISPSEVKIYLDPPAQYETIGIVDAVGYESSFSSMQSAQNKVIDQLKSRAAKMGANGVLLPNTGSLLTGATKYYSEGVVYKTDSGTVAVNGRAIYVIKE